MKHNKKSLPQIPNKRYFTIGEVGYLCSVKPHVLRYWEQEFPQLKPAKRRGNRRYYQREDVIMVRTIRGLLYDEGYTISGARIQLDNVIKQQRKAHKEQKIVQSNTQSSTQTAPKPDTQTSSDNKISYSVSFTIGENNEVTTVTSPIDSADKVEFKEHVSENNSNAESGQQEIDRQTKVSTASNYSDEARSLKKYKLILSEVINELQDLLAEVRDTNSNRKELSH